MFRDESACNTYNYGDSVYWDARYIHEASVGSFDWYQRYDALRPFVRKYIPTSSRVLMVGCGNAVISEDMVKDGYESIMNVDISCVAIEMMRRKYEHVPQLECILSLYTLLTFILSGSGYLISKMFTILCYITVTEFFLPYLKTCRWMFGIWVFFRTIHLIVYLIKVLGTLDALMCGTDAPISVSQMLGEVSRILKSGGVYMLITYGDPTARMPHINRSTYNWKIDLYIIPRPGFQKPPGSTSSPNSYLSPVPITDNGTLPADYAVEDPDSHFIYVCTKMGENVTR